MVHSSFLYQTKILFEVFWAAFCALALCALSDVLEFAVFKHSLHLNFSTA